MGWGISHGNLHPDPFILYIILMQDKGIWKQDPEANICDQEGWEWGVEKAP